MNKTLGVILIVAMLLVTLAGCTPTASGATATPASTPAGQTQATVQPTSTTAVVAAATTTATTAATAVPTQAASAEEAPGATLADFPGATLIVLGDTIAIQGEGATAEVGVVTITRGGAYVLSGTLADGQLIVDTQEKEDVALVLNGATIACSTSAPIYIKQAKSAAIVLLDGTENRLSDGETYTLDEEGEPNATLFSKDDLTIRGGGALTVRAHYNDGIASKDALAIQNGTITVEAVGDGIRGRDRLVVTGGHLAIQAGADGLKSTNDEDADRGFISLAGGALEITAAEDGIQAETDLRVQGGSIAVVSGGGSANASSRIGSQGNTWGQWPTGKTATTSEDSASAKGLKAGADLAIEGGTLHIDSSDDALHANGALAIHGGELTLASGDDGLHADADVTIQGGRVTVAQAYEGLEGATITIADGELHLTATDDGINVAGGADGSSVNGRPGQNTFAQVSKQYLAISGGYIYVDAIGDGIDVNGSITMSGGIVLVNGPTSDGNGALDYDAGFQLTGGVLVAAGSAGMAQAPDASSTQYAVLVNLAAQQPGGTVLHLEGADGADLLTFAPARAYQSLAFSSPDLKQGGAYTLYTGGSATGVVTDGLYAGGAYTGGAQAARFTLADVITAVGAPSRGGRGGFGGPPIPGGGGR